MQKNNGNISDIIHSTPKRLLILGAGIMQIPAIVAAKSLGVWVIVADANINAVGISHADEFWNIDLQDINSLVTQSKNTNLQGVMTCATDFSFAVATIAQACNLQGISTQSAKIANYKDKMRARLLKAGISIPKFLCLQFSSELEMNNTKAIVEKHLPQIHDIFHNQYPLVVKPVDNMGARGVTLVRSEHQLIDALHYARTFSISNTLILEEFLTGPELSIDSCIVDGKLYPLGIADRHIHFSPYFIETGHSIPSTLPMDSQKAACEELEAAAVAAGIQDGICKGDIIFHNDKIYIGEFAARLSGGYMSGWTIPYSQSLFMGNSPSQIAVKQSLHIPIHMPPSEKKYEYLLKNTKKFVEEKALLTLPGQLQEIQIENDLYSHHSFKNIFITSEIGNYYHLPKNNSQKVGSLIVAGKNKEDSIAHATQLLTKIYFKIKINEEANNFLFSNSEESSTYSAWRCYLFDQIELENRENLISFLYSTQLFSNSNILKPLPLWIPEKILQNTQYGTWTHTSIKKILEIAINHNFLVEVKSKNESCGGLVWSAILCGGWQGLKYLLQIIQECPKLLKTL